MNVARPRDYRRRVAELTSRPVKTLKDFFGWIRSLVELHPDVEDWEKVSHPRPAPRTSSRGPYWRAPGMGNAEQIRRQSVGEQRGPPKGNPGQLKTTRSERDK